MNLRIHDHWHEFQFLIIQRGVLDVKALGLVFAKVLGGLIGKIIYFTKMAQL